jgi:hypothetical protein
MNFSMLYEYSYTISLAAKHLDLRAMHAQRTVRDLAVPAKTFKSLRLEGLDKSFSLHDGWILAHPTKLICHILLPLGTRTSLVVQQFSVFSSNVFPRIEYHNDDDA